MTLVTTVATLTLLLVFQRIVLSLLGRPAGRKLTPTNGKHG
jgi:hypothetical protein